LLALTPGRMRNRPQKRQSKSQSGTLDFLVIVGQTHFLSEKLAKMRWKFADQIDIDIAYVFLGVKNPFALLIRFEDLLNRQYW